MKHLLCSISLLFLTGCSRSLPVITHTSSSTYPSILCGVPLLEARRRALDLPLDATSRSPSLAEGLSLISQQTISLARFFLEPFSNRERALIKHAREIPVPIVHRMKYANLRSVFSAGRLVSPHEATRIQYQTKAETYTPPVEDSLFRGFDCVFATVGPPFGQERYGDVAFHISPNVKSTTWATPSSGWYFIKNSRKRTPEALDQTGFDDQLHYSMTVVERHDFQEYMALALIAFLRTKEVSDRATLISALMETKDPTTFWKIPELNRLGYLEAKFQGAVPLKDVERIEVPHAQYSTVISWPEAATWKDRIIPR